MMWGLIMSIYDEINKQKQINRQISNKNQTQAQIKLANAIKIAPLMALEIKDTAVRWAAMASDKKPGASIMQGLYVKRRGFWGNKYLDMNITIYCNRLNHMNTNEFYTFITSPQAYGTLKVELEKMGFKNVNIYNKTGFDYERFHLRLELDVFD